MPAQNMNAIYEYASLSQKLEKQGGPERNSELFEAVISKEEEILASYGLPPAAKYSKILWKLTEAKNFNDNLVEETAQDLQKAAESYFQRPVESSLEVLKRAQEQKSFAFDILPELGYLTHIYTLFLYDELLLQGKASPEAILEELETVQKQDLYVAIARLKSNHRKTYRRTKVFKELSQKLQFLEQYLLHKDEIFERGEAGGELEDTGSSTKEKTEAITLTPEYQVLTDRFEVEEIIFDEDTAITVIGKKHTGTDAIDISLGFEFEVLTELLKEYGDTGKNVLQLFNKSRKLKSEDTPVVISLLDNSGESLWLDRHYFKIYKPFTQNDNGDFEEIEEEFYVVDEILDKSRYDKQQVENLQASLNGLFIHIKAWYFIYLNLKNKGFSEAEARKESGLADNNMFELSRLLYNLEKHGGTTGVE